VLIAPTSYAKDGKKMLLSPIIGEFHWVWSF